MTDAWADDLALKAVADAFGVHIFAYNSRAQDLVDDYRPRDGIVQGEIHMLYWDGWHFDSIMFRSLRTEEAVAEAPPKKAKVTTAKRRSL